MFNTFHALEHWLFNYRRVWYGSVFSGFAMPVLFLIGIGYGVGNYVDDSASLGGVEYAAFVAPGLLASTGLQMVAGEMTWPVFGALRWGNQYRAMQASPLTPRQMLSGHLLYGLMRGLMTCLVFLIVMGLFGVFDSVWAPLAIVPAMLVCFAVIGWVYAFSVTVKSEMSLSIIHRFGIVPISLFSGVFFPLSQLPDYMEPVASISPLWHATELARWAVSGAVTPWWWGVHAGYLLLLGVLGWWVATRCFVRRLKL
jgi:lipooligosaccharide transport system permease protein